jgi:DNA-binding transcriptional ArsR family regulator
LGLRLCRAMHESGKQRVRFSKFESLVLCVLRLVYHEQMQQVRDEERCDLSVGELRERLIQSGKPPSHVTRRAIEVALRRLAKHGLVDIERGFTAEDAQRIIVEPVIERVLPPDRIADIASKVRTYTGLGTSADIAIGDGPEPSTDDLDDPEEAPT